jgi:hypothetical protein
MSVRQRVREPAILFGILLVGGCAGGTMPIETEHSSLGSGAVHYPYPYDQTNVARASTGAVVGTGLGGRAAGSVTANYSTAIGAPAAVHATAAAGGHGGHGGGGSGGGHG